MSKFGNFITVLGYFVMSISALLLIAVGICYMMNGSLELNPTEEAVGKCKIAASCIIAVGVILELCAITAFRSVKKAIIESEE